MSMDDKCMFKVMQAFSLTKGSTRFNFVLKKMVVLYVMKEMFFKFVPKEMGLVSVLGEMVLIIFCA